MIHNRGEDAPSSYAHLFQPTLGERVEGDVIEGGDDQVGAGVLKKLLVFGPRQPKGRHVASLRRLHPVRGILDDEALRRRES